MKGLVEKIGIDKLAHLGIGGLVCACITFVVILQDMDTLLGGNVCRALLTPFIGTVAVMMFEIANLTGKTCCGLSSGACWCLRQSEWGYCFMCYQINSV